MAPIRTKQSTYNFPELSRFTVVSAHVWKLLWLFVCAPSFKPQAIASQCWPKTPMNQDSTEHIDAVDVLIKVLSGNLKRTPSASFVLFILRWAGVLDSHAGLRPLFAIHPQPKLAQCANGTCVSWILKFLFRQ